MTSCDPNPENEAVCRRAPSASRAPMTRAIWRRPPTPGSQKARHERRRAGERAAEERLASTSAVSGVPARRSSRSRHRGCGPWRGSAGPGRIACAVAEHALAPRRPSDVLAVCRPAWNTFEPDRETFMDTPDRGSDRRGGRPHDRPNCGDARVGDACSLRDLIRMREESSGTGTPCSKSAASSGPTRCSHSRQRRARPRRAWRGPRAWTDAPRALAGRVGTAERKQADRQREIERTAGSLHTPIVIRDEHIEGVVAAREQDVHQRLYRAGAALAALAAPTCSREPPTAVEVIAIPVPRRAAPGTLVMVIAKCLRRSDAHCVVG